MSKTLQKPLKQKHLDVINKLKNAYGDVVTRKQIFEFCKSNGTKVPYWLMLFKGHRAKWGSYDLKSILDVNSTYYNTNTNEVNTATVL